MSRVTEPIDTYAGDRTVGTVDLLVAALAVGFATTSYIGRTSGLPQPIDLGGDLANLAGFLAARADPDSFARDPILGDPGVSAIYRTLYTAVVAFIAPWVGGPAQALAALLVPAVTVYVLGFYTLGRVLFADRAWALLLAAMSVAYVPLNLGTYWGVGPDAEPRLLYAALLPFVLAMVVGWRDAPQRWPWIMLALAGLLYVHPVAGPGVALAVWTALATLKPDGSRWRRHLVRMILLGLVFVAGVAPFAWHYLGHWHGTALADVGLLMDIARERLMPGYLDLGQALLDFFANQLPNLPFWLIATASCAYLATRRDDTARLARAFAALFAMLLVFSFGATYAEHRLAAALGRFPLQLDLVRGFRYLMLFVPLFCLWPLAHLGQRKTELRVGAMAAGLLLAVVWSTAYKAPLQQAWAGATCLARQFDDCASPDMRARRDLIAAVRARTPPGGLIYTAADDIGLTMRYAAGRPVTYIWKDGGILLYADQQALPQWRASVASRAAINRLSDPSARTLAHLAWAREQGADYAILPADAAIGLAGAMAGLLFENAAGVLIDLSQGPR